jgi:hypothetical protein
VVVVADEPESLKNLVARLIREELERGGLDRLIEAHQVVRASFTLQVRPSLGMDAGPPPGAGSVSLSVTPRLSFDVGSTQTGQVIGPKGIASAEVVVEPTVTAEATVVPQNVIDAIRAAFSRLADEIQARDSHDAVFLLTAFAGLMAALQTAMQAYQFFNPQLPPPIVEIFNQTYNVVNSPSPHGAG